MKLKDFPEIAMKKDISIARRLAKERLDKKHGRTPIKKFIVGCIEYFEYFLRTKDSAGRYDVMTMPKFDFYYNGVYSSTNRYFMTAFKI